MVTHAHTQTIKGDATQQRVFIKTVSTLCIHVCMFMRVDGLSVISVPRSFGLSTTTGARGDAVSYVLADTQPNTYEAQSHNSSAPVPSHSIHGVVKVIKSQSTFQQELSALTLIHAILPEPKHAHYPRAIAASWAYIPTTIPTSTSTTSTFSRPYSVSSLASTSIGSTSSTSLSPDSAGDTCQGGLLLMECAPGEPIANWFKRVASHAIGSPQRSAELAELTRAVRSAGLALAELHRESRNTNGDPRPFIEETARQMAEMLSKLHIAAYRDTIARWQIDLDLMSTTLSTLKAAILSHPGHCCIIHGDAHAGNMLWDTARSRLTLIDLPTMLAATKVEEDRHEDGGDGHERANTNVKHVRSGKFRLTNIEQQQTNPSSTSSSPSLVAPPRHSGACAHPPTLSLHGSGLAGRDVCHFERKLDSFGSIAGMEPNEVDQMKEEFHTAYESAMDMDDDDGPDECGDSTDDLSLTNESRRFFEFRSILGEVTQLVRHEPNGIKTRLMTQLNDIMERGKKEDTQGDPAPSPTQ